MITVSSAQGGGGVGGNLEAYILATIPFWTPQTTDANVIRPVTNYGAIFFNPRTAQIYVRALAGLSYYMYMSVTLLHGTWQDCVGRRQGPPSL